MSKIDFDRYNSWFWFHFVAHENIDHERFLIHKDNFELLLLPLYAPDLVTKNFFLIIKRTLWKKTFPMSIKNESFGILEIFFNTKQCKKCPFISAQFMINWSDSNWCILKIQTFSKLGYW